MAIIINGRFRFKQIGDSNYLLIPPDIEKVPNMVPNDKEDLYGTIEITESEYLIRIKRNTQVQEK
jgi:hypothetical protein